MKPASLKPKKEDSKGDAPAQALKPKVVKSSDQAGPK